MRTRECAFCGELYESEAKDDVKMPFCSKDCRKLWSMTDDEREYYQTNLP